MKQAPKRLKVLFLTKWYPNKYDKQLGIFVQKHAKALSLYADVALLYACLDPNLPNNYQLMPLDTSKGFTELVIYYKQDTSPFTLKRKWRNMWRYIAAHQQGLSVIFSNFGTPDLVHVNVLSRPALIAWYLKMTKGIPYYITAHASAFLRGNFAEKNRFIKKITHFLIRQANAFTVVSKPLQIAMQQQNMPLVHAILPNVVEVASQLNKSSSNRQKIRLLSVGDLYDEVKNISGVLKAVYQIKQQANEIDFEYHIIGGGRDLALLQKLALSLNLLPDTVFFHGLQDNAYVLNFMHEIDFLVLNSRFETFSIVTAEALACGKPVIATRCGGPEIFINEQTGLLIPVNDQAALEKAIIYLLHNYQNYSPDILSNHIIQQYSYEIIGQQMLQLYAQF